LREKALLLHHSKIDRPIGHKRRIGPVCNTSASPLKPDIRANIVGRRFG
jgi:hypothetical protein